MKWKHKCSFEWLVARQDFLTASDVRDLIPYTKTGRKRTVTDDMYFKVLARKLVTLSPDDCMSYGAAARGHVLEPYAIAKFNKEFGKNLRHWDDVIVHSNTGLNTLAFSPDAMDMECPDDVVMSIDGQEGNEIAEVKCYSNEKHLVCGHTKKEELEERWQIAVAMAVCKSIEKAYLIFYNPSMQYEIYVFTYTREDLEDEIADVLDVQRNWHDWLADRPGSSALTVFNDDEGEEKRIVNEIMKREEFDPENEKTVWR